MIYNQENISKFKFRRVFNENVDSDELIWHRDLLDRKVTVESGNDWMLQIDNELPKVLQEGQTYIIPRMVYHRVIKGTGDLKIIIDEGFNQVRVPRTIKNEIKKNFFKCAKSGIDMSIPRRIMESEYVFIDTLNEIKDFFDKRKDFTLQENYKGKPEKDITYNTFLSFGGQKSYDWIVRTLVK